MEIWNTNNNDLYTISKLVNEVNKRVIPSAAINIYFIKYLIRTNQLQRINSINIGNKNIGVYSLWKLLGIYAQMPDGYHFQYDNNKNIIVNKERIDCMKIRTNEEKKYEDDKKKKKLERDYNDNLAIRGRFDRDELKEEYCYISNILKEAVNKILKEK